LTIDYVTKIRVVAFSLRSSGVVGIVVLNFEAQTPGTMSKAIGKPAKWLMTGYRMERI
jgi:hypothetical protein